MAKKKQKVKDAQVPVPEPADKPPEEVSVLSPEEEEDIIREMEDGAIEYCLEMAFQAYTMVISKSLQPFIERILKEDPPTREEVMDRMMKIRVGEKNLLERILSILPNESGRLPLFKK